MKSQRSRLIARGSPLLSTSIGSNFALWRKLLIVLCLCLFGMQAFAGDPDVSAKDLKAFLNGTSTSHPLLRAPRLERPSGFWRRAVIAVS